MIVDKDMRKDLILPEERKAFALSYLMDFSISRSASRCKISTVTAQNWLKDKNVIDFIVRNQTEIAQKCNITQEEVLNELGKIAFFKHDYLTDLSLEVEEGTFGISIAEFENIDFSAVQSVVVKMDKNDNPYLEIRPYNKVDALKSLQEWFIKSKIPENVHFHITREDLAGRSAADVAKDYHDLVQNARLPSPDSIKL